MSLDKQSKFLSYVLRHRPDELGIVLDLQGWTDLQTLVLKSEIPLSVLEEIVATDTKGRYTIRDGMIRANQGHSVKVELDLQKAIPPSVLYHGTSSRFLDQIANEGLKPMKRHHVHLSAKPETAWQAGSRRGACVLLEIDTISMEAEFFISENGVWLVSHVPFKHITVDQDYHGTPT